MKKIFSSIAFLVFSAQIVSAQIGLEEGLRVAQAIEFYVKQECSWAQGDNYEMHSCLHAGYAIHGNSAYSLCNQLLSDAGSNSIKSTAAERQIQACEHKAKLITGALQSGHGAAADNLYRTGKSQSWDIFQELSPTRNFLTFKHCGETEKEIGADYLECIIETNRRLKN